MYEGRIDRWKDPPPMTGRGGVPLIENILTTFIALRPLKAALTYLSIYTSVWLCRALVEIPFPCDHSFCEGGAISWLITAAMRRLLRWRTTTSSTVSEDRVYPGSLLKDEKRNFRRKCQESFMVKNGQLFYRKFNWAKSTDQQNNWKLCLRSANKKRKVLNSCHSSAAGVRLD